MLKNTTKIRGRRIKGVTRIICRSGLQSLILSTSRKPSYNKWIGLRFGEHFCSSNTRDKTFKHINELSGDLLCYLTNKKRIY